MKTYRFSPGLFCLAFLLFCSGPGLFAQPEKTGTISGIIVEKLSGSPLEFATVTLGSPSDSSLIQGTVTDKKGQFAFPGLKFGNYRLTYSYIGYDKETRDVSLGPGQPRKSLGKLALTESSQSISEVQVTGKRSTFVNSIDRKTFHVGQDLMSTTGSLADLLQRVPSLQVDVDGNVSLRGSQNVTILVNGKPSAIMNLNPAAVLQQMQASSIEKIEIITNPSAKYKPDGTAGIINLVTRKVKTPGFNGTLTANAGNEGRYNGNILFNYNPGKINFFGSAGMRHDDRIRVNEVTTRVFEAGKEAYRLVSENTGHATPNSELVNMGMDWQLGDLNAISVSATYNHHYQRQVDVTNYMKDSLGVLQELYSRNRVLPELESELEITSTFKQKFRREGHELNLNYTGSFGKEFEDNYYTNNYTFPKTKSFLDNMFYHHHNNVSQFLAEYVNPLADGSRLEAGYELDRTRNDMDLNRDTTDVNGQFFFDDLSRSSHFIRSEDTHVLYVTYEREIGKFSFLGGLRAEQTFTKADLVTTGTVINSDYSRLYPTLHLGYNLREGHQLQVNYSHRIRRPEDEQMNPFPEYQDLMNERRGNPYLKPEDIHSMELGYQLKKNSSTFISTLYYRYNYNGITSILTTRGDTVVSTLQNLSKNQSAGLELVFSTSLGKWATVNLGSNTFYNTIDASELGYSSNKSDGSYMLNASLGINLSKQSVWQITSNYNGEQLTPQGKRLPYFVLNSGFRQELFGRKAALILTVSDLFNTLRNGYQVNTPDLTRDENRRRSSRFIYVGFSWNFGKNGKKQNGNGLKYDNQI